MESGDGLILRPAEARDAEALADLMTQLGYPSTPQDLQARLRELAADPSYQVLVAELRGSVVGAAAGQLALGLERSGLFLRVIALVVDEAHVGQGLGRRLLAAIEDWGRGRGADAATLTSAHRRKAAHGFYESRGYACTGLRYFRWLR